MSNVNSDYLNKLLNAKQIVLERMKANPSYVVYQSVEAQLNYIISVIEGSCSDRTRLKDVNLGIYAVREFEGTDDELSKALKEVHFIVYTITGGAI